MNTQQVLFRIVQLTASITFAALVFYNSRSLFKNTSTVFRSGTQYFLNAPLTDDGVGFFTNSSIHEQLGNILEPARLLIDHILTVTTAMNAAGYSHFAIIERQSMIVVIQR
ncbi:hypothetical protein D3C73_1348080 [compost metagenome]